MSQAPPDPVIVRLYETPHDSTGLSEVFVRAVGLTGALIVLAVVAAGVFAVVLFWRRSRST